MNKEIQGGDPQINRLARHHLHAGFATLSSDFLHDKRDGSARPTEKALLDAAHRISFASGGEAWQLGAVPRCF
jgi:dienelactone hydrolase